jgi:hypothetical protein
MCVFNEYNKLAIVRTEGYYYNVFDGLIQENHPQSAANFLFFVQDEIKRQRQFLAKNIIFNEYFSYQEKRLGKLREIEQNLSNYSEEKKGEVLEEEKKLLRQVINHSLLRRKFYDDTFRLLKPLPNEQPESIEIYSDTLLNASSKYWLTVQEEDEIRPIFDRYAEEFVKIENYEKRVEKCKYYQGFYFHSTGKWKFQIKNKNDQVLFSHESPVLCLYQKEENIYYPYKYMVVCIDFQMENGGSTEKKAYKKLELAFSFYFQNIFKEDDGLKVVVQIVEKRNIWKDTFNELSAMAKERNDIPSRDHLYKWALDTGISNA